MRLLRIVFGAGLLVALTFTETASASTGFAAGSVNLRAGPGSRYARIATIPAGARVEVFSCSSWCHLRYGGYVGWASARYIATTYARPVHRAPVYRPDFYEPYYYFGPFFEFDFPDHDNGGGGGGGGETFGEHIRGK